MMAASVIQRQALAEFHGDLLVMFISLLTFAFILLLMAAVQIASAGRKRRLLSLMMTFWLLFFLLFKFSPLLVPVSRATDSVAVNSGDLCCDNVVTNYALRFFCSGSFSRRLGADHVGNFQRTATYVSIETLRSVCLLGRTLAIFMELQWRLSRRIYMRGVRSPVLASQDG